MTRHFRLERRSSSSLADFDDQRWPIACALSIMAGLVAGVIWLRSDFSDPRPLYNGWVRLAVVAATLVVLVWGSALLERRVLRRLQLCILLSLLFHLGIVGVLHERYLELMALRARGHQPVNEQVVDPPPVTLPDYSFDADQQVVTEETLVRPVETEPTAAETELQRQSAEDRAPQTPNPTLPQPVPEAQQPSIRDLQRAEVSAPREATTAGQQLSRQELRPELPAPEAVPQVEIRHAPQPESQPPQPAEVARRDESLAPEAAAAARLTEPADAASSPAAQTAQARLMMRPLPRIASESQQQLSRSEPQAAEPAIAPETPDVVATRADRQAALDAPAAPVARSDAPAVAAAPAGSTEPRVDAAARPATDVRRAAATASEPVLASVPAAAARRATAAVDTADVASHLADTGAPAVAAAGPTEQPLAPSARGPARVQARTSELTGIATTAEPSTDRPSRPERITARPSAASGAASSTGAATIAPSAMVRRQGDVSAPSSLFRAEEVRLADTAASRQPADVEASASATTVARQFRQSSAGQPSAGRAAPAGGVPEVSPSRPSAAMGTARRDQSASPATSAPAAASSVSLARDGVATQSISEAAAGEIGPQPDIGPLAATAGQPRELQPETTSGRMSAHDTSAPASEPFTTSQRSSQGAAASLPGSTSSRLSTAGQAHSGTDSSPETGSAALAAAAVAAAPPVDVPAPAGVGGVRRDRALALGLSDPLARPQSDTLQSVAGRFVLERSFGSPTVNARITENPIPEFRQRKPQQREKNAAARGATAGSERAVELGLDFLARHQSADGRWSLDHFDNGKNGYEAAGLGQMQSDTAATGLALLAFFGAGYTHLDGKYRLVVGGGLDYLVSHQKPDGDLFTTGSPYVWLYSHGIASIALCEAYGMTRDPRLREPAQRALDFILAAQHPTQGGWRYSPQRESDTSVSGWQMMALKSGELSGLSVPRAAYDRLSGWLDHAQAPGQQGSQYVYLPVSRQPQQRTSSIVMTAEALLMRMYLGWERNDPRLVAGADHLLANLPRFGTRSAPARDAYYWYYATQVMFQVQGPHWEAWNVRLRDLLVNSQVQEGGLAGSWDPLGEVPDRWGRQAGRVYVTAMHLLMLEVYYRHLPLYKTLVE